MLRAVLPSRLLWPLGSGPVMSGTQTPEHTLDAQGDSSLCRKDEDIREGTQSSHRMLGFSDALLSIIATVMVSVGPTSGRWRHPSLALLPAQETSGFFLSLFFRSFL